VVGPSNTYAGLAGAPPHRKQDVNAAAYAGTAPLAERSWAEWRPRPNCRPTSAKES